MKIGDIRMWFTNIYIVCETSLSSVGRVIGERAKRVIHYQGCTNWSWWVYICMEVRMP